MRRILFFLVLGAVPLAADWWGRSGDKSPATITLQGAVCHAGVAATGFNTPTVNAPTPACATGTNTNLGTLQFDAATAQSVQTHLRLPDALKSVSVAILWISSVTTGNVLWQLETACAGNGESLDPAFGTAQTVTAAAPGAASQIRISTLAALTVTGCQGKELWIRFSRAAADPSDTLAGSADVVNLSLQVNR